MGMCIGARTAKVTVVLDKSTKTRLLIEKSGYFILQVPTLKQLKLVQQLGSISQFNDPEKLSLVRPFSSLRVLISLQWKAVGLG
jgi:flavin reductase (DIM6/NTAB) family NADH-FMN oxidoreductase RutF